MQEQEITLNDLKKYAERGNDESFLIRLELQNLYNVSDSYSKFVDLIERAIDFIGKELAKNPKYQKGLSEDQITNQIVNSLRLIGFDATHDTENGGHCDIVIEACNQMLWLGEAKMIKSKNNNWLYKGYNQLYTRYSTGNDYQDRGGMIVYCFAPYMNKIMNAWKDYLQNKYPNIQIAPCKKYSLAFYSEQDHIRTGRKFIVRHIPISFYFSPED